ncbi:metal-dependent transcriptional regulator [Leucobacter luti]|uniref:DtxR family iron (Metal) dependent repressor n=1 Tax=Leucobacter luti TaxID=340320 RepID=A0A4Q7TUL6_9MICO|nr:metal-dependent transcriptional regulator [Leucobacter luti]MBL3698290.1 metal-dependent transcriptional regulator [Leucobacter luti]RZT64625.1 DtxR family iron (metal) dependent repressor [Leucobacter luti]
MDALLNPTEAYLGAVLECEEIGTDALRARLAERIGHAPSTVTQTANRLIRDGLLFAVPGDRRLYLTPEGRRLALRVMRKHRLAECLLVDTIGLDWAWAHTEASRWEHAMGDRATELIAELLHHPERSPYGNPIPTLAEAERGAALPHRDPAAVNALRRTFDADPETPASIVSIGETVQSDPALLERFAAAGALPGTAVLVERSGIGVRLTALAGPETPLDLDHAQAAQVFVA